MGNGDISPHLNKAQEDLNPLKALDLFKRISDEDCELLGLRPEFGRPEEYIWQYICVPPVCIRPSVAQDGATNEDDVTIKLTEIIFTNSLLKLGLVKGGKGTTTSQLVQQWEFLQLTVALYINSELPGVPTQPARSPVVVSVSVSRVSKVVSVVTCPANVSTFLVVPLSVPTLTSKSMKSPFTTSRQDPHLSGACLRA